VTGAGLAGVSVHVMKLLFALALLPVAAGCGSDDGARLDPPPPPAATRDGRWIQDVDYMTLQLARLHPNLFFATPRATFEAAAADLAAAIPRLADPEVVIGLMRLAALPGDAHTSLYGWAGFHRLPLRLARLADGLYVVAAEESLAAALGARVLAVGDVETAELETRAAALVSHENEAWLRVQVPQLLVITEVLAALGATDVTSGARVWLQPLQGGPFALDVAARTPLPVLVDLITASGAPVPLHQQRRNPNYWFTTLEGSRSVYLQYNRCRPGAEPFADFAARVFRVLDQGGADRLVVDVRDNGGGDTEIDDALIQGLQERPAWRRRGRLFCLIQGATFSAGMWTALELQRLGAVTVGAPTGGKPNSHGNARSLFLPNSQLEVGYSTRFNRLVEGADPPSVLPELPVEPTIDDLRLGRDPLLDAALGYAGQAKPGPPPWGLTAARSATDALHFGLRPAW
jgi:hypothetical protein